MNFEALLERLPSSETPFPLSSKVSYISYCQPNESFLHPDLSIADDVQTSVLAIAAGGAVGKSTLAKEIASRASAVYCDLSQINVGTGSYQGLVLTAFGPDHLSRALDEMKSGRLALVLDSLDEAQARAGDSNFEAFLDDIAENLCSSEEAYTLVLLGRYETIDRTIARLKSKGVASTRAEVRFFDRAASSAFIDAELDRRHSFAMPSPHRRYAQPFQDAKETLLDFLTRAVEVAGWSPDVTRSLLGYAPVLHGIAAFLDTENFYDLVDKYTQYADDESQRLRVKKSPWGILSLIVNELLAREQGKFVEAAKGRLAHLAITENFQSWGDLYSRQHQLWAVAHYIGGGDWLARPAWLPSGMYTEYAALLSWFLPQHPFIGRQGEYANVLFGEYVRAWQVVFADDDSAMQSGVSEVEMEAFLPTPIFAQLLLQLATEDSSETSGDGRQREEVLPLIDARFVGRWYESLMAGGGHGLPGRLIIYPWDDSGRSAGSARDPLLEIWHSFLIDTDRRPLVFEHRLRNAQIEVQSGIELGVSGEAFHLGPEVSVVSDWLQFTFSELRVDRAGSGVVLEAQHCESPNDMQPRLSLISPGRFECGWSHIQYPWRNYVVSPNNTESAEWVEQVNYGVRRILRAFSPASQIHQLIMARRDKGTLGMLRFEGHDESMRLILWALARLGLIVYASGFAVVDTRAFRRSGFEVGSLFTRKPDDLMVARLVHVVMAELVQGNE